MKRSHILAVGAAVLFGVSSPLCKVLLGSIGPMFMAAFLYLGAGLGMAAVSLGKKAMGRAKQEAGLTRKDLPFVAGMVVLDIGAPFFLMLGLTMTGAATVSLLSNFEIVATTLTALAIFKESVSSRLWGAVGLITLSSVVLTLENPGSLSVSPGALFVLLACVCWGFENNCTRMLSLKDPTQVVVVKGFGSGLGALLLAFFTGERAVLGPNVPLAFLLGFVAYGLSIYFYVAAQRELGAARTSAFYGFAPFMGAALSFALFRQPVTLSFLLALALMAAGAWLAASERHEHRHLHPALTHEHRHSHDDGHHNHVHEGNVAGEHNHPHVHEEMTHTHPHGADLHHTHAHG